MIDAVGSTSPLSTTPPTAASTAAAIAQNASLLPAPSEGAGDPMAMMFLIQSKDQQVGFNTSATEIHSDQNANAQAYKTEQAAIQKQEQAEKHKSFWDKLGSICGDIAKVAGVVASIAAAVATCGAASPLAAVAIAGAVLSTAGFADSTFGILKKLGVSDKLTNILDASMSIGGAAMSVGAGLISGAQAAASTASTVSKVAGGVSGVGQVGHGVSAVGSGEAQCADDKATADQVASESQQAEYGRMMTELLGQMKDEQERSSKLLQTISGIKTTENQTALYAASGGTEGIGS